jgi:quercetin dioxygenase-like cupin family protein
MKEFVGALLIMLAHAVHSAEAPPGRITVTTLQSEMLSTSPGKRLSLLQLDVAPGASAAPHQHEGYLFVYVVSGEVRSQITGDGAPVNYEAGHSFVEKPGMQHLHFENASTTEPARLVISWFADDGATQTRPLQ